MSHANLNFRKINKIIINKKVKEEKSNGIMDKLMINLNDYDNDNELNDDFNIDNKTWLSEKPISVLQLDLADRAVLKIADQRDKIQKKTFTKWINKYLKQVSIEIIDLFEDLKDGNNLITLLELLSHKNLPREKGTLRFHALQNIQLCLDFLTKHKIRLVNIRSDEIVDGNPKLTLGLIWIIILHFQVSEITGHEFAKDLSAKDALMLWVQKHLDGYNGVQVRDFSHSWRDGKAFIAIMHRHKPEKIELEKMYKRGNKENLQYAFDFAEKELNVTKLLDPEDVDVLTPDEKSIITYVSSLYDAIPTIPIHPNQIQRDKEKRGLLQEYTHVAKLLIKWLNDSIDTMTSKKFPNDFIELKSLVADLKSFRLEEYALNAQEKRKLAQIHDELKNFHNNDETQIPIESSLGLNTVNKLWEKLDASLHMREILLEKSIEKFENMQKNYDRLNKECKLLNENLNFLQEKINFCSEVITSNNEDESQQITSSFISDNSSDILKLDECERTLSKLESSIHSNDQILRKLFTEAKQLQEECFPNIDTLIDTLCQAQKRIINILVHINSQSLKRDKSSNTRNLFRVSPNKTIDNELLVWIRAKQDEVNQITFKCDLIHLKNQIELLSCLNNDVKNFSCKLDQLNKQNKGSGIDDYVDDIFNEFRQLCFSIKKEGQNLDSLYELTKLIHQEIKFFNEIEDIELNRDWSQLNKLNSNELFEYKNEIEAKLSQRKSKISYILGYADRLISNDHPASNDIQNCINTIKSESKWVHQLIILLDKNLQSLRIYEQFYKNYEKIDNYLDEISLKYEELKDYLSNNSDNLDDCNSKISKFKKSFDQFTKTSFSDYFDNLYETATKMPAYKIRQKQLKQPFNKCKIQTQYNLAETIINEGEECLIEDNTNRLKWKVLIINRGLRVEIPSVCFILAAPEQELIDQIDTLKIKYERINDSLNYHFIKIKTDKLIDLMNIENQPQTISSTSNIQQMLQNFKEEIDYLNNRLNEQSKTPEINDLLIKLRTQFKLFTQKLNENDNNELSINSTITTTTTTSYFTSNSQLITNASYTLDSLEMRITNLFKNFYLLCEQVLFVHMRQQQQQQQQQVKNSLIKKNDDLEKQLKNFINSDLKKYENDLNLCEKNIKEAKNTDFQLRFDKIKTKYHDLMNLSSLYSQNFKLLDQLSLIMDEFSNDLNKIENMLSKQHIMIHGDLDSLKEELDNLNNLEHLFKLHDKDLNEMQCIYNKLKYAIDKVRSTETLNESNDNKDDIEKLSHIIEQLNDRWSKAFHLFTSRKSSLKQLLQTYKKYKALLNTERNWPQLIRERIISSATTNLFDIDNTTVSSNPNDSGICSRLGHDEFLNQTFNEIIQKSTNIEDLNQSAIAINQFAKNLLNEQENQQKELEYENFIDLNEVFNLNSELIGLLEVFKENVLKYQISEENKLKTNQIDLVLIDKKIDTLKEFKMNIRDYCGTNGTNKVTSLSKRFYYTSEQQLIDMKNLMLNEDKHFNSHNYPQCRIESTASEYRLSLSDFIELNLIDESNGLIINPLNGQRLTLMEAIKLDLINSDIKEIANIYDSCNSKLTIKEAINLKLLNSQTNEFLLTNGSNSNLKLINFYEAKEKNLIIKPLTLSEAFLLNLIDRNGYVKNPSNEKLIQFACLFKKNSNFTDLLDLDTKHIIDPSRSNKKLLSINEAIDANLILPLTFEVCTHDGVRVNFYDAFYTKNCLNLILYKPEIDNIFVKLSFPSGIKLKRDKIGLIESLYLNLLDLNNELYINKYLNIKLTFQEAIAKNLIDKELIDILNTSIGIQRNGVCLLIKDCIKDYSLYLEKYLFKNPFTNEYMHLDSFKCKKILEDKKIRLIKRLITRVNVKNYFVSFNSNSRNEFNLPVVNVRQQKLSSKNSLDSPIMKHEIKTLTVESVKDAKTGQIYSINDAIKIGILDKQSLCFKNTKTGQIMSLNDAHEQGFVHGKYHSGSLTSKNHPSSNKSFELIKSNDGKVVLAEKEELNYQISSVIDIETGKKLTLEQALKQGIIDKSGIYFNKKTGAKINLNEAFNRGFIDAKPFKKDHQHQSSILKIDVGKNSQQSDDSLLNDSVLYEINEIEETVALPVSSSTKWQNHLLAASTPRSIQGVDDTTDYEETHVTQTSSFHNSIQIDFDRQSNAATPNSTTSRVEKIIEDDNDINLIQSRIVSMNGNATTKQPSIKMRSKSTGKNIQERQIPSFYGSNQTLETLIIDDNRRSASLNIEGETHVYKNEVSIESAGTSSSRKLSVASNDEQSIKIVSKNGKEQINCVSLSDNNEANIKKESSKRSTVIVIDDNRDKMSKDKLLLITNEQKQPTEFNAPRILNNEKKAVRTNGNNKELLIQVANGAANEPLNRQSNGKHESNNLEKSVNNSDNSSFDKLNESNGEEFQQELNKCSDQINELELQLVKQSPLSDKIEIFQSQKENYNEFETILSKENAKLSAVFVKCTNYLNTGSNSSRENKLKSSLRSQLIELKDRNDNLNEHSAIRRKKIDSANDNLEKFTSNLKEDYNLIANLNAKLDELENNADKSQNDLNKLKELESECKSIDNTISTHQTQSKDLRVLYQNFAQIATSFNKDLQLFASKIKNPFKRNEINNDFNNMKTLICDVEEKYEELISKSGKISNHINDRIELLKKLSIAIGKFDGWLAGVEDQVKITMEKYKASRLNINLLREYQNIFDKIKFDIDTNKRSLDDLKKLSQNNQIENLTIRFNALEKAVNQYYEFFTDKLTQTKSTHEQIDSIMKWLNEADKTLNTEQLLKSQFENKLDSLKQLKNDLGTKRQALITTQNIDLVSKEIIDQLSTRFDKLIVKVDARSAELAYLNNLTNDFYTRVSNLNDYLQKVTITDEKDYLLRSLSELDKKNQEINDLSMIVNSIKNQYFHLFDYNHIQNDINQIKSQYDKIIANLNTKINEIETNENLKTDFSSLKASINTWMNDMNKSIQLFEPIVFDINAVESQYEQLDSLLSEYDQYHPKLVKINELGNKIDEHEEVMILNENYQSIGEQLEARKSDLVESLEKLKLYLQELHLIDNNLNDLTTKFNRIFLYDDNSSNGKYLPISRNVLNHITSTLKNLQKDLDDCNRQTMCLKQKQDEMCKMCEFKELVEKSNKLSESINQTQNSVESQIKNLETYEQSKDELRQSLEHKNKLLSIFFNSNQLSDVGAINGHIVQLEAISNALKEKDHLLMDSFNCSGQQLIEKSIKRDSEFLTNELNTFNTKFTKIQSDCDELLATKNKIRDLCLYFNDMKEKFYENLNMIDGNLDEINVHLTTIKYDIAICQLDELENSFEAQELLKQSQECVADLNEIQPIEDLKKNLIQMIQALNATKCKLSVTKDSLLNLQAKDVKINALIDGINKFVTEKLNEIQVSEPLSAICENQTSLKSFLDILCGEIETKKDELRRLVVEFDVKNSSKAKDFELLQNNFNTLNNNFTEKYNRLNELIKMSEHFNKSYDNINSCMQDLARRMNKDKSILNKRDLEHQLKEIDNLNASLIAKNKDLDGFIKLGDEIRERAQIDQEIIDTKIENIRKIFETSQNEALDQQLLLKELYQRINEYEELMKDAKQALNEKESVMNRLVYDCTLNDNNTRNVSEFRSIQDSLQMSIKPKLELINEITRDLFEQKKLDNLMEGQIKRNIDDLDRVYDKMDKKVKEKLQEFEANMSEIDELTHQLKELFSNIDSIEGYLIENNSKTIIFDEDFLKSQQSQLIQINDALKQIHDMNGRANEEFKKLISKRAINWNDPLKEQLNLASKSYSQLELQSKLYDKELQKSLQNVIDMQKRINECNTKVMSQLNDIDLNKSIPNSIEVINNLITDHRLNEHKILDPLRHEVVNINQQANFILKDSKSHNGCSLRACLDGLNENLNKLENRFKEKAKLLELTHLKSTKFEKLIENINSNLNRVAQSIETFDKTLFKLQNIHLIKDHLVNYGETQEYLASQTPALEDLREVVEKLFDAGCSHDDQDQVEKRMDATIEKWSQLTRKTDEKIANLNFISENLTILKDNHDRIMASLEDLESKFSHNLIINCLEPIVIKSQYERMREINDALISHSELINETKELNESLLDDVQSLSMLDKNELETSVSQIELKYGEFRSALEINLDLVHRLYPLCEQFSHLVTCINESINKCDRELDWLKLSSDDETSSKEKQNLIDEIQSNSFKTGQLIETLELKLSRNIIGELNNSNIKCDEFIDDLNENLIQIKKKFELLNASIDCFINEFIQRKNKSKEVLGELDDLQEWLDEVEGKLLNVEGISCLPDVIKSQIQEQSIINQDIQTQNSKLKHLIVTSKKSIRDKIIEDSIELKEKFNTVQNQVNNLLKVSVHRTNELEQALVISTNFGEVHGNLKIWFDQISQEFNRFDLKSIDKDSLNKALNHVKQIDRDLFDKKVDFDNLNKSGQALIKICGESNQIKSILNFAAAKYDDLKENVKARKDELESLLWVSAEFADKVDNLAVNLNATVEAIEYTDAISAHPEKLKQQIQENQIMIDDLNKRKQALNNLLSQQANNEHSSETDQKINELETLWSQLKSITEKRAEILVETLEYSESFWVDYHDLAEIIGELEERIKQIENETVAMDPDSVIEQQKNHEDIVSEINGTEAHVEQLKNTGIKLITLCGKEDQSEIQKSLEEIDSSWDRVKNMVRERQVELQDTFGRACEFQQQLIEVLEWIGLQQEKFTNLDSNFTSNDAKTIRFQIELLQEFKTQVDPKQLDVQVLNQNFNELKSNMKSSQSFDVLEALQEPLNSANKEWKRLQSSIVERKSALQNALLSMGQFNDALDEMIKWLELTHTKLNDIETEGLNEVKLIDIELAKLKVLQNDIRAQEQSVEKIKETAKNVLKNETTTVSKSNIAETKAKVQHLVNSWNEIIDKSQEKQSQLNSRYYESQNFQSELQDTLLWLSEIENSLIENKPFGGLPETAKEQLTKFMVTYNNLNANEAKIELLIKTGLNLITEQNSGLHQVIETLNSRWSNIKKKAEERREKLGAAYNEAVEFDSQLQKFIVWLTNTEKTLNILKPVSRVLDTVTGQISEHQILQKNIAEHREQMLSLDKLGTHIKYFSQKQDVILVKNLLISVQNRWAKCVSRSAERTRDLERGFKDAQQFSDLWNDLITSLTQNLSIFNQDLSIGNQPAKIKAQISKHKEFHRQIGQLQTDYEFAIKLGRKLIEKSEAETDRVQLQDMLNELKNKWQSICYQSIERQKKLEDALLCSGQFRDALQALFDWLKKAEVNLDENRPLNGDLDCVLYLVEENQKFEQELQYKRHQLDIVHKAANELMASSSEDVDDLEKNLAELDSAWNTVNNLHEKFKQRLDSAFNLAKDFHASIKARLDWMIVSEQNLKFSNFTADNESGIIDLIEQQQVFVHELEEQEIQMKETISLGQKILSACVPEAYVNLKHWLAVLQSRWDEILYLSEEKTKRLNDMLNTHRENEFLLNDLLQWLQTAETQLTNLDQKQLPTSVELIENLIQDHQEFQNEMIQRQPDVDRITKSNSIKVDNDYFNLNSERKKSLSSKVSKQSNTWKTPEPKMKNPRVKQLFDKWRNVWLLSLNRHTKLKDCLERYKELERLKNFNFEEWRKRYMNWIKDSRARIMDFFRRQDKDHDGKISREEFIEGILKSNFPTTRLELEAVADIFDVDKDGFIDYKEFFATLKPNTQIQKPNVEKIRDEVQRQVSLCKCSKRYHVLQISDRHYRFGDSQKLRLVRILQSTVMVRVGGGWIALDEFLVKNDPCRAKGRTNFEIRDQFIMRDSLSQQVSLFSRPRSPSRGSICTPNQNQSQIKSLTSTSRSIASSSEKRTPRSSLSQSNEHLLAVAAIATRSPSRSVANSQSGSLGASMSDLSSEAASEYSDHLNLTKASSKTTSSSGISQQQRKHSQSKLPIPKKQQ